MDFGEGSIRAHSTRFSVGGPVPRILDVHAGWSNGRWLDNLRRTVVRAADFGFDPPDGKPEFPFIEAIDAEAPSWTFVNVADAAQQADLTGAREIAPGRFFLPHDSPLKGFEDRMPHLLRHDGKAVIFPAGRRSAGHHDPRGVWFLYADDEVFFFFPGWAKGNWDFDLAGVDHPSGVGLRREDRFDQPGGLPVDLFVQRTSRYQFASHVKLTRNPSPSVTQRVTTALLDAGLAWRRGSFSVSEVPDRIVRERRYVIPTDVWKTKIGSPDRIDIRGGYIGGLFNSSSRVSATLANA
jgi:hypothetical protein